MVLLQDESLGYNDVNLPYLSEIGMDVNDRFSRYVVRSIGSGLELVFFMKLKEVMVENFY